MVVEAFVGGIDQRQGARLAIVRLEGHGRAHAHDTSRHAAVLHDLGAVHLRQQFVGHLGQAFQRGGGQVGQPLVVGVTDDDLRNRAGTNDVAHGGLLNTTPMSGKGRNLGLHEACAPHPGAARARRRITLARPAGSVAPSTRGNGLSCQSASPFSPVLRGAARQNALKSPACRCRRERGGRGRSGYGHRPCAGWAWRCRPCGRGRSCRR